MKKAGRLLILGIGVLSCFFAARQSGRTNGSPSNSFVVDTLAKNLIAPWEIAFLPDRTMLFTERAGRVRLYRKNRLVDKPALTVSDVETTKKMGLLGLCIHPDFSRNKYVYLAYNYKIDNTPLLRVVRHQLVNDSLMRPKLIIEGILANQNHTGCRLKFGPDRKLYITTGDADRAMTAQDLKSLNGKILRVNDDASIPSDNPFVASDTARKEVWSYGHRNPQGLAFQSRTGLLFDSEHGPSGGDEVNQIERGKNYGWPRVHHRDTLTGMVAPLVEYTPSVGPAEAIFYEADAFPALKGNLLVAALRGESIIRIQMDGNKVVGQERLLLKQYGRIRALAIGPDGYIYFSTSQQDPPEGQPRPGYDMVLRLRPVPAGTSAQVLGPLTADSRPMGEMVALNNAPESIYQQLCANCHGENLQGTDRAKGLYNHTYGTTRTDIVRIIRQGIPEKGMPAWDGAVKQADIDRLADFILAKTSTNPPSIR